MAGVWRGISGVFDGIGEQFFDVFLALAPIVVVFAVMNIVAMRMPRREVKKIVFGFFVTYIGLVLFMQGVFVAFKPAGSLIGQTIGDWEYNFLLIPLGFCLGFVTAFAEPAVWVLNKQVEEMSAGSIKRRAMLFTISIGVAAAVALAMVKLIWGISLWWFVLPGFTLIFIAAKFVDPRFTAIAFDAGGVATGPMCTSFVMSFTLGAAKVIPNANPMRDALGMVTLVAMAPVLSIMMLSLFYKKEKVQKNG